MALAAAGGVASFDLTANTVQLDLSNELAEIIRTDNTVFLSRLPAPAANAKQRTHYWNEDKLIPNTATASGSLTDSATTLNVTTGQGVRFKVGSLIKDRAQGTTEVMQVTAVSTDALTIVRGYGSTTGEAHASGWEILIIAHARQEDQDMDEDDTQERTSVFNRTQISQRGLRISYTREKVDTASGGIPSEFAHQTAYRLKEEMRSLDNSIINGIRSDAPSDTAYGSMGGLIEYVTASGGNSSSTAEDLVETVVNDMAELIVNDAGEVANGFLLVSPKQRRNVSLFDQAFRRGTFDQTKAGFYVEKFVTDMGYELEVVQDPWVPNDTIVVGDLAKVKVSALQGDEMRFEELAKLGRSMRGQVTGQYTMEIRNALEAFACHTNLNF